MELGKLCDGGCMICGVENLLNFLFNLLLLNNGLCVCCWKEGWGKLILVLLSCVCCWLGCLRDEFKCCIDVVGKVLLIVIILLWVCKVVFLKLGVVLFKLFMNILLWLLVVLGFFYNLGIEGVLVVLFLKFLCVVWFKCDFFKVWLVFIWLLVFILLLFGYMLFYLGLEFVN